MTDEKIRILAREALDEAIKIRRYLHRYPELGNNEHHTTKFIADYLEKNGIKVYRPLDTGVIGELRGKPGKIIALRADIDALPINETTGLSFASENYGIMHGCGHDFHTASLLVAAGILSRFRDDLCGDVRFIFQPDEEGNGGAKRLMSSEVLSKPFSDAVFGFHMMPSIPADTVAVRYGKSYAASDMFNIEIFGKSAHGAEPENGISALKAAACVVEAVDGMEKHLLGDEKAIISFGVLHTGTAGNIIPDYARLEGIIRTLGKDSRALIKKEFVRIVEEVVSKNGATTRIEIIESYPGVVNEDKMTEFIEKCARDLFGEEKVLRLEEPQMTTEDFGYYLEKSPGSYYHIGGGGGALHTPTLNMNEDALFCAVAMHIKSVFEFLGNPKL